MYVPTVVTLVRLDKVEDTPSTVVGRTVVELDFYSLLDSILS